MQFKPYGVVTVGAGIADRGHVARFRRLQRCHQFVLIHAQARRAGHLGTKNRLKAFMQVAKAVDDASVIGGISVVVRDAFAT